MSTNLKPILCAAFACFVSVIIHAYSTAQDRSRAAAGKFVWISPAREKQIWAKVVEAFAKQLLVDDPANVSPNASVMGKTISRIGLYGSSALILIRVQDKPDYPVHIFYVAYVFSLKDGRIEEISNPRTGRMWGWRFVRVAQFEKSTGPDIVFEFLDCLDCEAVQLLASFRYGEKEGSWRIRLWDSEAKPETGSFLMIGADSETGETNDGVSVLIRTSCVYKVADLNGDGLDDVATWCKVTDTAADPPNHPVSITDTTLLFTAKDGTARTAEIKKSSARADLHRRICVGQEQKPLCRNLE